MFSRSVVTVTAAVACAAAAVVAWTPAAGAATGDTLTVNVNSVVRPVTHVAAGGLYGVDAGSNPPLAQLYPLHLNNFTQPPPDNQQLGNAATSPCCGALAVGSKVVGAGATQYIRMPDIFPHFPYSQDWVSWSDYESKINTMVQKRLDATTLTNVAAWELWNEPDGTWPTDKAGPYLDGWTRIFRDVRAKDATTPIVGPGYSHYDHQLMVDWLTNAKNTNTLPSTVIWHELQDQSYLNIQAHVADVHSIEDSLGLAHLPVSINEYGSTGQIDQPSASVHYMASLERAGVHDAERAYWYEAGTMNGLLYRNNPTASYWAYKWYGDQSGNIVQTVPTTNQYFDGVASYDTSRKQVNLVFGGVNGDNTIRINGMSGLGSSVRVLLSRTNNTGRMTNESAPVTVSSTTYTVSNGSISVPVTGMDYLTAYQALVTPASGAPTAQTTYEAENATVVNANRDSSNTASNGGYVGQIDNNGDMRNDSFVDFLVNVPSAKSYTMAIRYANATGATSTQGLSLNGGSFSTVSYPATANGWGNASGTVRVTVSLNAGYNRIRLAKGSPGYGGGQGYAELDNITLT